MRARARVIMSIFLSLFLCLGFAGCKKQPESQEPPKPHNPPQVSEPAEDYVEGELICVCESQNDAQKTAELYGIELKSFSYGVAVFATDEDLDALIEKGKENGWPELSKNYIQSANSN